MTVNRAAAFRESVPLRAVVRLLSRRPREAGLLSILPVHCRRVIAGQLDTTAPDRPEAERGLPSCPIDIRAGTSDSPLMSRLLRVLCITLLAAFALGTVLQAASVGAMAPQMGSEAHASVGGASCDTCPDADIHDGTACYDGCISLYLAALPATWEQPTETHGFIRSLAARKLESRADPPAVTPPRVSFLM